MSKKPSPELLKHFTVNELKAYEEFFNTKGTTPKGTLLKQPRPNTLPMDSKLASGRTYELTVGLDQNVIWFDAKNDKAATHQVLSGVYYHAYLVNLKTGKTLIRDWSKT